MTSAPPRIPPSGPNSPTLSEMADESLVDLTMPVIGLTVCPGFLLCVPAIGFALVLALLPLVAVGVVALAAGLVAVAVAAPLLVARSLARRVGHAYTAKRALVGSKSRPPGDPAVVDRTRPPRAAVR
jgi:hypothetical protein